MNEQTRLDDEARREAERAQERVRGEEYRHMTTEQLDARMQQEAKRLDLHEQTQARMDQQRDDTARQIDDERRDTERAIERERQDVKQDIENERLDQMTVEDKREALERVRGAIHENEKQLPDDIDYAKDMTTEMVLDGQLERGPGHEKEVAATVAGITARMQEARIIDRMEGKNTPDHELREQVGQAVKQDMQRGREVLPPDRLQAISKNLDKLENAMIDVADGISTFIDRLLGIPADKAGFQLRPAEQEQEIERS